MDTKEFIKTCEDIIIEYYDNSLDATDHFKIKSENIYCVWYNTILGNNKGLFSTNNTDGMYFEITYNTLEDIFYFDAYKKWLTQTIEL